MIPSGARGQKEDGEGSVGIVVAGLGAVGLGYVLADRTCKLSRRMAGAVSAVKACRHELKADRILAERNFGGAMVEHVIRTVDPGVSLSRGDREPGQDRPRRTGGGACMSRTAGGTPARSQPSRDQMARDDRRWILATARLNEPTRWCGLYPVDDRPAGTAAGVRQLRDRGWLQRRLHSAPQRGLGIYLRGEPPEFWAARGIFIHDPGRVD